MSSRCALLICVGGRKSFGTCPEHHAKGAGGLLRHILQELERVGIVEMDEEKGRKITVRVSSLSLSLSVYQVVSGGCIVVERCNNVRSAVLTHAFVVHPLVFWRESRLHASILVAVVVHRMLASVTSI